MKTSFCLLVAATFASCTSTSSHDIYEPIATSDAARTMDRQPSPAASRAQQQTATAAPSATTTQAVQLTVASRQLDNVWTPVDEAMAFGLAYSYEAPVLGYELGLQYTSEDDDSVVDLLGVSVPLSVQLDTMELYGGVRKTFFEGSAVRPYVGAGVTLIQADAEFDLGGIAADFDDQGFGGYVRAGLLVPINDRFRIGLDARFVRGVEFDFDPAGGSDSLDGDFDQFGLVFEYLF